MSALQFEKSQIVKVPGLGFEGRISGCLDFVNREAQYEITWLDQYMVPRDGVFTESQVIEAQKKPADSTLTVKLRADTAEAEKAIDGAALKVAALNKEAKAAVDTLSRLPRNVFGKPRPRSKRRAKR